MNRCIHCGKSEHEHCPGFEAKKMPVGCQCDEGSWSNNVNPVNPICGKFIPGGLAGNESYCATCEHNKECHT